MSGGEGRMGWLWGSSDSSTDQNKLDSSLREFLKTEAPTGPNPALPPKPKPQTPEATKPVTEPSPTEKETPQAPAVPPESQFQDGRYAHLWKSYVPQQTLENRGKTEQDKLREIVDAYNDRKASIGRAAMENCAMEYLEQFNCMKNPSFTQAMTVCRTETRKFNKCYETQAKFMKALGYLSMNAADPERDERIQMHADKLWQQLKQQEEAIEKAKEEGTEMPQFESVLSSRNVAETRPGKPVPSLATIDAQKPGQDDDLWSGIKPERRAEYEKKLSELPAEERDLERQALLGELRAQTGMAKQVEEAFVEERINRMKRRELGQATIGDTIKRLWGWG
ncbi:hypothetical protein M011DRAFT_482853 [Sporormia fimetaria CBS 119925]|uniref:Autophagy protein n=1 Tax=Sporormia fimetaria CBS 119925 TaxID=1340428 RepID=A0A6A6VS82_9PLEO|nr:hypothetical protein M011DRAFT_482853 [Sporormia fimetaria CBS 119925]